MKVSIRVECEKDTIITKSIEIMNRHMRQRNCNEVTEEGSHGGNGKQIILRKNSSLPEEGFRIDIESGQSLVITGGSSNGVLYGIGKMLRTGSFTENDFGFGSWQGESAPQKSIRALYLATHFHNYYHVAPLDEVKEYLEDNALRGYNVVDVTIDKHHYSGADDPNLLMFVKRVKEIFLIAAAVGMKTGLSGAANEGYHSTPEHLRATPTGRSFFGCEICPSTDEGLKLILDNHEGTFRLLSGINLDYLFLWPYDQGGCSCEKCRPWGSVGMVRTGREVANVLHKYYPSASIIYSTWLFDYKSDQHEWEGLTKALQEHDEPWLDMILADSQEDFPEYPLVNGVPGNRKMINFPEISMWGMFPWGAYGANPLVNRFKKLWGEVCDHCDGGMLYSEGIYEDINKAVYAGFYWNGDNETSEIMAEYFSFEYGSPNAEELTNALDILEKNHFTKLLPNVALSGNFVTEEMADGYTQLSSRELFGVKKYQYQQPEDALEILSRTSKSMPEWARHSWRWRILFLRAVIDVELKNNNLEINDKCDEGFEELAEIFHSNGISEFKLSPLTRESIAANRRSENDLY